MEIPFLDLRSQYLELKEEIDIAVLSTLDSGWYILGDKNREFEEKFKKYLVNERKGYVVGCNSGTDAIVLSLLATGIKPGDEVITVANTAIPTVAAICSIGAIPVFAEIDKDTWLLEPSKISDLITANTRAIIPVHLYGNIAPIDEIKMIADDYQISVIEDVAQALGGEYNGHSVGTIGRFGAFSFYPTKNLGCMGDGGAVFCKREEDYKKLQMLRNYGQKDRYTAESINGVNSRLDEIQAAILSVKIPYIKNWNKIKGNILNKYKMVSKELGSLITFQEVLPEAVPAWHLLVIKLPEVKDIRAQFIEYMTNNRIQVMIHYPYPIYKQKAFGKYFVKRLSITEGLCERIISLPFHPYLNDEIKIICDSIITFFRRRL